MIDFVPSYMQLLRHEPTSQEQCACAYVCVLSAVEHRVLGRNDYLNFPTASPIVHFEVTKYSCQKVYREVIHCSDKALKCFLKSIIVLKVY